MITDKEYPATHSMSTAWYVADEDGNVGIMDFNENGPVPWEIEETCVEDLVFGLDEDYRKNIFLPINLTDEQIDDLITNPHSPKDEKDWGGDSIVKIDLEQEDDFLKLARHPDIDLGHCISKRRGLYYLNCFDCLDTKMEHILKTSTLKKMLDKKMILTVYKLKNFWMEDELEDDKVVHKKSFDTAPYYIFHQPYWNNYLPECMNEPEHPVTLEQFPEKLRKRVLRLPIKFRETKTFQIAEWHPCRFDSSDDVYLLDGFEYTRFVKSDGSEAYVNTSINCVSFYGYCSEKSLYQCEKCTYSCASAEDNEFARKPTIVFVFHSYNEFDYGMTVKSDPIIRHSIRIPFLLRIPFKHPKGYYMLINDVKKQVTRKKLAEYFLKNHRHFEVVLSRIKPHVLILEKDVFDVLNKQYSFKDGKVVIDGSEYPYFRMYEMDAHREEIMELANRPYRGIEMPYIISAEEMEKLKADNKLKRWSDYYEH